MTRQEESYQFFPKSARAKLPPLYSQEQVKDPIVHVKFFTPWTNWTWYATEFDGKDIFFGWIVGLENELGYFSLSEMQGVTSPTGLKIERDIHFHPKPLSQVMANYGERLPSVQIKRTPPTSRKPQYEFGRTPKLWYLGEWWEYEHTDPDKIVYRSADGIKRLGLFRDGTRKIIRGERVPQIPPLYATPERKLMDDLERLWKSDPDEFYRKLKDVKDAIKERERGKIKKFPDISLIELRHIKAQADRLYR